MGYITTDYMKRKTLMQDNKWTGPWRYIDIYDIEHTKLHNAEKKKQKRRARRNMKQELRSEPCDY